MFNQCRIYLFWLLNMLETVFGAFLFTFFFVVLKALQQINAEAQKGLSPNIFTKTQVNLS